jgi:hypothetical protein
VIDIRGAPWMPRDHLRMNGLVGWNDHDIVPLCVVEGVSPINSTYLDSRLFRRACYSHFSER